PNDSASCAPSLMTRLAARLGRSAASASSSARRARAASLTSQASASSPARAPRASGHFSTGPSALRRLMHPSTLLFPGHRHHHFPLPPRTDQLHRLLVLVRLRVVDRCPVALDRHLVDRAARDLVVLAQEPFGLQEANAFQRRQLLAAQPQLLLHLALPVRF